MKLNPNIKFYLVIGSENCTHHSLFDIVAMAVNNGVDIIQLREKNASTEKIVQIGNTIQPFLKIHNIPLIINDNIEAAKILDADGVHVGQHDTAYKTARKFLGSNKIIGLSIENATQIDMLKQYNDVDYIGIGPIFSTNTKKDAAKPLGITSLKKIRQMANIPVFAIGGIDLNNINDVMQTGVQGAAIVSAICNAENPNEVCKNFKKNFCHKEFDG
ncbi:MAG: thiamine phosphate synthase [Gammaproteobacteria bacterium]